MPLILISWRCLPNDEKAHAFYGGPKSLCDSVSYSRTDRTVASDAEPKCSACADAVSRMKQAQDRRGLH